MAMNDWRVLAENVGTGLHGARVALDQFGYDGLIEGATRSRLNGLAVAWLTSSVEAHLHKRGVNRPSFRKHVVEILPLDEDPNFNTQRHVPWTTTRRERCEALWGIRVAATHSDLNVSLIDDETNQAWARNTPNAFDSATLDGDYLNLMGFSFDDAIWTIESLDNPPTGI